MGLKHDRHIFVANVVKSNEFLFNRTCHEWRILFRWKLAFEISEMANGRKRAPGGGDWLTQGAQNVAIFLQNQSGLDTIPRSSPFEFDSLKKNHCIRLKKSFKSRFFYSIGFHSNERKKTPNVTAGERKKWFWNSDKVRIVSFIFFLFFFYFAKGKDFFSFYSRTPSKDWKSQKVTYTLISSKIAQYQTMLQDSIKLFFFVKFKNMRRSSTLDKKFFSSGKKFSI